MELKSKATMDVPIDQVFAMLIDFEAHQRSAMRRGAEVTRLDSLTEPGAGAKWKIGFEFRGKARMIDLEMVTFDRPEELGFEARLHGLDSAIQMQLVALSKTRTRLNVNAEMTPTTLSARLLMQSLKLAKSTLTKRFDKRLAAQARDMEDRYSRMV
mgnify:CR=1 FL=1